MSNLDEYHRELMADIRREADSSGIMMVEAFFDKMTDRLTEAGELETADRVYYQSGEGAQKLRIDGYAGHPRDSEGVLGLIVCDFVDGEEVQLFGKPEIVPLLKPLIRFLESARTEKFRDSLNEINPGFQISDTIIAAWPEVTKVKLILISNRKYIGRDDAVKLSSPGSVPITWSVWDLARFERFDRSGQAREEMVIDFAKDFGAPLPALKASQNGAGLESYLLIVPGEQLAAVYDRWGARLLEANVRSFLQARARTNKGIQKTIKEEPELFFPYNNGLSSTAEEVACVRTDDGLAIASIRNLQIVNGAQTTGSIHAALKSPGDPLAKVYVQMKLTVVPPDRSEDIVPKISEYANTQNKVNAADFFSNHPFHVRIEQFSRRLLFPAADGGRHDSKWFYERSRGQFVNARNGLTVAQLKNFDLEFPKAQLFSKTDLAKFEFSATGKPHIVSQGAQKNFAEFAKDLGSAWAKNESIFDETWFRRLIAKAIIFRKLETEIPKQSWYSGGYRANIVTYAMAKVFHDANRMGQLLDLDSVARRQMISEPLLRALLMAAEKANSVITHPVAGMRNMSEWAKKQGCWGSLECREIDYGSEFQSCLISAESARAKVREGRNEQRELDGIAAQTRVVDVGPEFWRGVLERGTAEGKLSPRDQQILRVCAEVPRRVPSELQARHALHVLERLEEQGVTFD